MVCLVRIVMLNGYTYLTVSSTVGLDSLDFATNGSRRPIQSSRRGQRWSCGVPENARGILGCFGMLLVSVVKVVDLHSPSASAMLARARCCLRCYIFKIFYYLCSRFTSKVWNKADVLLAFNAVDDV